MLGNATALSQEGDGLQLTVVKCEFSSRSSAKHGEDGSKHDVVLLFQTLIGIQEIFLITSGAGGRTSTCQTGLIIFAADSPPALSAAVAILV